jgi:hypothetical protein
MPRTPPPTGPVNGVRIAIVGTSLWGVALIVVLVDAALSGTDRGLWIATTAVGLVLGLIGIGFLLAFERRIVER